MHRSATGHPSSSLGFLEASDLMESESNSTTPLPTVPSSTAPAGLLSPRPVQDSSITSNEYSQDQGTTRAANSSAPRGLDTTVGPVPTLPRKPPLAGGGNALRRPKRVMMHTRGPSFSPITVGTQMLSPVGTTLSRQASMMNHSTAGLRGPFQGSFHPLSPLLSGEGAAGVAGPGRLLSDTAKHSVWPLASDTTGNQMGRNVDSHVYLKTHVMSELQRQLLSPTQPLLPFGANQANNNNNNNNSTAVGQSGTVLPPPGRARAPPPPPPPPLPGAVGASNTPSAPTEMLSLSSSAITPQPRRPVVHMGSVDSVKVAPPRGSAHVSRPDAYFARPTSPLSGENSLRIGSPVPAVAPSEDAVSRLPSCVGGGVPVTATTTIGTNSSGLASPPPSRLVRTTSGANAVTRSGSGDPNKSSSNITSPVGSLPHSAVNRVPSGVTRRTPGEGTTADLTPPSSQPPQAPTWPLAYFQRRPKVEMLEDLLRLNAALGTNLTEASNANNSLLASPPPGSYEGPADVIGSGRGSRLASPNQDPLSRAGTAGGPRTAAEATAPRRPGVFGLFGLLERSSRFEELYGLYAHHPFLRDFYESIRAHIKDLAQRECLPWIGRTLLTILSLIEDPAEAEKVGLEYYRNPIIAWPLHVLYLVSCYRVTAQQYGFSTLHEAIRRSGGLLSMGKGLFAALAVAMSDSEEALRWHTARMLFAAFTLGVVMRRRLSSWESHLEYSTSRSFSFLLVNIPLSTLRQLVEEVNECRGLDIAAAKARTKQTPTAAATLGAAPGSFPSPAASMPSTNSNDASVSSSSRTAAGAPEVLPRAHLEVSRVITSRSAVVCGHPLDLDRLDIVLTRFANATGVKIHKDFIPSSAPENSSFYNEDMVFELLACWQYSGTVFDPNDLYLPMFSPVQGERWDLSTMRTPEAFARQIAEAVTYRNQDLTYSLQHIVDGDCLLDFTTLSLTTGAIVEWTNRRFDIISVPANRRERSVLPPPRRSQQPAGVRGTLYRMAVVNDVLDELVRESAITLPSAWRSEATGSAAPRRRAESHVRTTGLAAGVELSTTFEELGLLLYVKNPSTYRAVLRAKGRHEINTPPLDAPRRASAIAIITPPDSSGGTDPKAPAATGVARAESVGSPLTCDPDDGSGAAPTRAGFSTGSTAVDVAGSSSRSGGGDTVRPGTSTTSGGGDSPRRTLRDEVSSPVPPVARSRHDSGVSVPMLTEDMVHAMPTIFDPEDASTNISPIHQNTRPPLRGYTSASNDESEVQIFSTSIARRPGESVNRSPRPPPRTRDKLSQPDFVMQKNAFVENVVNVYQVSPLVRYYEMQFGCVLCDGAVAFTERLKSKTGVDFPPYMLLMCPTVFALLEVWDGFTFVEQCCKK